MTHPYFRCYRCGADITEHGVDLGDGRRCAGNKCCEQLDLLAGAE